MTASIESTFLEALKHGPVVLFDNMKDRTHAGTHDPLVDHSPLIRLAILAVDLGADPDRLEFWLAPHKWTAEAVMYNVGADCPELTRALQSGKPALGFHYCPLNAMYFVDEIGIFGERIKTSLPKPDNENVRTAFVWFDPMPARFDRSLKHHIRVVERIKEHFERQGWTTAAERLAKCIAPPDQQPSVEDAGTPEAEPAKDTAPIGA